MPAVIYSHGLGGTHSSGADYAAALAERGYVVYCFDFCGGSNASRSDGSTLEMSIFTEQADLEAALRTVQGLDVVDSRNIFLLGTSQGGAVSAITGAANTGAIRGMALLYPAFSLVEDAKTRYSSLEEIPPSSTLLWLTVGRDYYAQLKDYDIYEAIRAYTGDVLILHGDADNIVPLSSSQKAAAVYPSAQLEVFPGAGHGFYGADEQRAIELIAAYYAEHMEK